MFALTSLFFFSLRGWRHGCIVWCCIFWTPQCLMRWVSVYQVLLWLKQWDSCVFGSEIRSTTDDVLSALKRHSSLPHHKKVSDTSFTSKNRRLPYSTLASTNYSSLDQESSIFEGNHVFLNKKSRGAGPPDHKVSSLTRCPLLAKPPVNWDHIIYAFWTNVRRWLIPQLKTQIYIKTRHKRLITEFWKFFFFPFSS